MKIKQLFFSLLLVVALTIGLTSSALADKPVTGAISTTDNPGFVGPEDYVNQAYLNGQGVNGNIYADKRDVWFSGLPVSAALGADTYFFAVLVPGGQGGNDNPNDGTEKNLSDDFDTYTNRTFTVDGDGNITDYQGTHNRDGNLLQLFPYADTTNPGGEYILAVCSLANGYPVDPNNCKYDAFKIKNDNTPPAQDLIVTKTATPSFDKTFTWSIAKSVDQTLVKQSGLDATFNYTVEVSHDGGTPSNWQVTGQITVENPNLYDVSGVIVTDTVDNGGTCAVVDGESVTVPGEGIVVLDYTCTYTADGPIPSYGVNTAVATWWEGPHEHVSGTASFDFATTQPRLFDNCVTVTDSMSGDLGTVCATDANPTFFTYAKTVTGEAGTCKNFDNTATFTTNTSGVTGSASVGVKLCVGADLTVTKTATPFFTRTYLWDITKDVDKTLVKQFGGSAIFNYTVNAFGTGYTDSDWALTGTITVSNPNDWEDVTADLFDDHAECVLTQTNVTVPAKSAVEVAYTCAMLSGDSGLNTATATWDAAAAYTPNGSASGSQAYAFEIPTTEVNKVITVTDTFDGTTSTLGTVEFPGPAAFNYARTILVPTWNCISYDNIATIVETGQNDSETVTVCGPIKTGALTMGFWQNKNGQGIVKAGASTAGVCNSGTWLRQFAPFQDLSATATCTQVATYVTNVIKAANASGASMNAMLKGQMLATSLDVYFSNPALGGNKIGAPTPIGGVSIDLTKICTDMTCTTFEDSSSVFGGSPKTVLEMLTYAASQSNIGGKLWYGNVKSTQELAKDAFDAINNQKVFAP